MLYVVRVDVQTGGRSGDMSCIFIVDVKSLMAAMMIDSQSANGIMVELCGSHFMVWAMRSALVLLIQTQWQR